MFCNKCGKNNNDGLSKCAHCGAPMSSTVKFSGFADILSFEKTNTVNDNVSNLAERNDEDMQKLIKKTDNIMNVGRKNALFNLITIGVCVVTLLVSVVLGLNSKASVNDYAEDTGKRLEQIEDKIAKIDSGSEIDDLLKELEEKEKDIKLKDKKIEYLEQQLEDANKNNEQKPPVGDDEPGTVDDNGKTTQP